MAQDRKVFVGGVPQDLTQDDLYAIFSEYAGVKKAWLQKCRNADESTNSCPPQSHRGFGFVIFHDAAAIDELLGQAPSRFVMLRSGAKLEVKRALSSNKMGWTHGSAGEALPQAHHVQDDVAVSDSSHTIPGAGDAPGGSGQRATHRGARGGRLAAQVASAAATVTGVQHQAAGGPSMGQRNAGGALSQHQGVSNAASIWAGTTDGGGLGQLAINGLMAAAPASYSRAPAPCSPVPLPCIQPAYQSGEPAILEPQTSGCPALGAGSPTYSGSAVPSFEPQQEALRQAIIRFYREHRPEKLSERDFLDFICSIYVGREAELDHALRSKYGEGLSGILLHGPGPGLVNGADDCPLSAVQPQTDAGEPLYIKALPPSWLHCGLAAVDAMQPTAKLVNGRGPVFEAFGGGMSNAPATMHGVGAAGAADVPLEELEFVGSEPDLDQIAADLGVDVSEEVARAIVSRSATLQRKDWLQSIVVGQS